jgi:hypothetical protein
MLRDGARLLSMRAEQMAGMPLGYLNSEMTTAFLTSSFGVA